MQNGSFRHLVGQAGGAHRSDPADLVGVRPSAGHYRVDLASAQGNLDIADLHSLAHPVPGGALTGFMGPARGNRSFDLFPHGLSSMLPSAEEVRAVCAFSAHSQQLMASNACGSPHNSMNGEPQRAAAQLSADYRMRGKPTQTSSPYFSTSPHGLDSPIQGGDANPGCLAPQNFHAGRRKWPLPGDGAHHDALTELARENLLLKHQLTVASAEVDRLKHVLEAYDISQEVKNGSSGSNGKGQSRYWTEEEHQRFLDAIQNYGHKDVKAIASVVGTRNATQVRTHAQKYFIKLARSRKQSQATGQPLVNADTLSNPDRDDMAEDPPEELADTSLEAAAAAAAAAGEAGTSAAAAAAFVAATRCNSKQSSQHGKKNSRHEVEASNPTTREPLGDSSSNLVSSNVERVSNGSNGVGKIDSKTGKTGSRHRKRSAKDGAPGSPGSMGSSGSLGSSDATSNGNGSNGSNGVRSSDTTNGNGSSNGAHSNSSHNENGSSGDSGGGVDSNNGASSNEGSDHGFFDTVGEDGGNFSDELEGAGGGSDEGYMDHAADPRRHSVPLDNACGDTDMRPSSSST